uniref:Uncharacterized protein n=1 Tax=Caenorhabditis japonica TaxID=281687 RepID=A0A8R1I8T2_CAEJA
MGDVPNTSIKQEILDKSIVGSSRKPIELDDDEESSDGENSVIILDSDTEAENADVGDEEEDEDGNGEEDLEEESEDEDEEESEEDSDSSVDSESVDSVWSDVGEANGDKITTEAAEVQIVKKFEKAMILIADNKPEHGKRTLEKLLEDPIIAQYKMEDTDYELLEEPPMLARMLQIFIAAHKNLAKLNPDEEVSHLCQVLAYEPNNSIIWLDVAMKSVENGDLNFAKYAFKKCESLNESLEAHATVLYISCEYSACLKILKMFKEETDGLNDKMKYLKYKIRSTNQYYKQLSDRVFEEDEVYAVDNNVLDQRKILVFDERIGDLMKKVEEKRKIREAEFEKGEERLSPIHVKIFADQE